MLVVRTGSATTRHGVRKQRDTTTLRFTACFEVEARGVLVVKTESATTRHGVRKHSRGFHQVKLYTLDPVQMLLKK